MKQRDIEDALRRAKATKKPQLEWDDTLKGFGFRASPSGTGSWLVQKWQGGKDGKAIRYTIGHHPPWDLQEARNEAQKALGDFARGIDLPSKRKQARAAKREEFKAKRLGEAVEEYLTESEAIYLRDHDGVPGSYWKEVRRKFDKTILPGLGKNTPVREISSEEIDGLVWGQVRQGHHGAARYTFAIVRAFFKWCVVSYKLPTNPMLLAKPVDPLQARDRVLTDHEIKRFWAATEALEYPFDPFYRLLLLTAQRRDEVAGMEWTELDLERAEWTIPKERSKNGKAHLVHLSPQAMAVLSTVNKGESPFVFTTTGTTKVTGYGRAKDRLGKAMKPDRPWRVHDLRRTAASGMAALKFPPHVIERVLNHVSGAQGGLVGVYQRHEYIEERRAALHAWGSFIETLVMPMEQTNVIFLANHNL